MKKLNDVTVVAVSVALIVFGILFCLNNVIGATLDIIFGICFIILGVSLAALSVYKYRRIVSPQGVSGGAVLAFGVAMIDAGLIGWFIYIFVPFAFIVYGAFLIAESFLSHYYRGDKNTVLFVIELLSGVILLTLGILAVSIHDVQFKAFNVIEGVILILVGICFLVSKFAINKDE